MLKLIHLSSKFTRPWCELYTFLNFLYTPYLLKLTVNLNYIFVFIFPLGKFIWMNFITDYPRALYWHFFLLSLVWAWTSTRLDLAARSDATEPTCRGLQVQRLAPWSSARLAVNSSQSSFQNVCDTFYCHKIVSFLSETANCRCGINSHDLQLVWS